MATDGPTTDGAGTGVGAGEYRIELDAYAGPMDLLLYLVKKDEVDLADIPIARLAEQYLAHLRVIEAIDVDRAGEFLVMAATLLEIKSQMMVPMIAEQQAAILGDDEGESADAEPGGEGAEGSGEPAVDPRRELVEQLLAYKSYRDAADALAQRGEDWSRRAPAAAQASAEAEEDEAAPVEIELDDAHVMDLCSAFARLLDSIGNPSTHAVTYDDTPISLHAEDVIDLLKHADAGRMQLAEVFSGRTGKSQMIGLFLAMLELVRQRKVRVVVDDDHTAGSAEHIALEVTPEEEWVVDGDGEGDVAAAESATEPV
ncbi:MAG: segregation/condensation protein A [Planctomycetota bacterium]